MKTERLDAILDIIREKDIATQEELQAALRDRGFEVTQATVSRDIRYLQLVKRQSGTGKSVYAVHESRGHQEQGRLLRVLQDAVRSVDTAQNILVIKTEAGMAMAAAAAIAAGFFVTFSWPEAVRQPCGYTTKRTVLCLCAFVSLNRSIFRRWSHTCCSAYTSGISP